MGQRKRWVPFFRAGVDFVMGIEGEEKNDITHRRRARNVEEALSAQKETCDFDWTSSAQGNPFSRKENVQHIV
jgi:hypothetical protein